MLFIIHFIRAVGVQYLQNNCKIITQSVNKNMTRCKYISVMFISTFCRKTTDYILEIRKLLIKENKRHLLIKGQNITHTKGLKKQEYGRTLCMHESP